MLPVTEMILYKHGVGFFVREGTVKGDDVRLMFKTPEINDILKSIAVYDKSGGTIRSMRYQTPTDRLQHENPITLSPTKTLTDLLTAVRGRRIQLSTAKATYQGQVVGLEDLPPDDTPHVTILTDTGSMHVLSLVTITGFQLMDEQASDDLAFFLKNVAITGERKPITLDLSDGEHDLVVYYIAPSPTWRVSYRLLADSDAGTAKLQGWALFDNSLQEDLKNVTLTLVTGQPISFIYKLFESHIPERPTLADEDRTLKNIPKMQAFADAEQAEEPQRARRMPTGSSGGLLRRIDSGRGSPAKPHSISVVKQAVQQQLEGEIITKEKIHSAFETFLQEQSLVMARRERQRYLEAITADLLGTKGEAASIDVDVAAGKAGEFFQYRVASPVTVNRGDSAMVPIIAEEVKVQRELIYDPANQLEHPLVAYRLKNTTTLTLDNGPVTIITDGSYQGEAVVPFTIAGADIFLPFAVELGIHVAQNDLTTTQHYQFGFQGEYLVHHEYKQVWTTTTFTNTTSDEQEVVLIGSVRQGWALYNTPDPAYSTGSERRWRVPLPPGSTTEFVVKQRMLTRRRESLTQLNKRRLTAYLAKNQLNEETAAALDTYLDQRERIQEAKQTLTEIEQDRRALYAKQEEIRKNITTFQPGEGREGQLYDRMLDQFEQTDDRLAELENREQALHTTIQQAEAEAAAIIEELTHDQT